MQSNILVAEDDRNISNLIREIVERRGDNALLAKDGEEALQIFCTLKVDLVITDLKMPRLDGMTLISRIRERDQDLPIIIVTGYGSEKNRQLARQYGVSEILSKPCSLMDISRAIERNLPRQAGGK
jgi:DNA-binding response OmpR family regulator